MGKQRNRGTIALSEEGKTIVLSEMYQRGWTRDLWASEGYTSVSTVKRLLKGNPVEARCFHSLLKALGLEVKDSYIRKRPISLQSLVPLTPLLEELPSQEEPGVFMTATFVEAKRSQIERALRHLQKLLINGEVKFSENKTSVTVSGEFFESNRPHIEMTISQLEELFESSKVTW